jgi:uncharacterized protein with PQ loop repeat
MTYFVNKKYNFLNKFNFHTKMDMLSFADAQEETVFSSIVGWMGNCLALFFFLSPAVEFWKVWKGKIEIKHISYLMIIVNVVSCILWVAYGLIIKALIVYVCNGTGCAFSCVYLCLFWGFFFKDKPLLAISGMILSLYLTFTIFENFYWIFPSEDISGNVAMVLNIIMYAAPGSNLVSIY